MKILDRLRNRSPRGDAGDPGAVEASSAHEQLLPIAGYDRFDSEASVRSCARSSCPQSTPTSDRTEAGRSCSTGCAG